VAPTGTPAATPEPLPVGPYDPLAWPNPDPGVISVNTDLRYGEISPLVYGSNIDPAMLVPVDLVDEAAQIGLTFMRFPGGGYGDQNEVRPEQYDAFMKLARQLGTEPNIHVRVLDRTAEDAADIVRYVNVENDYGVRYWAIGNEPSLFYNDIYTAESYAQVWREFALAMKAVDPSIMMVGPEITQFATSALEARSDVARAREWMRAFLATNGDLVDVVSIHRYPFPISLSDPTVSVEQLRPTSAEFDVSIRELRDMIREITGRDIPVAVTEVNSDSSPATSGEATPASPFAAVWLADVLGRLIRNGVSIVAQYAFQTRDSRGGWGLLNRYDVRPQYYVYQLYQRFGDELVYSASDDPNVTAYAAVRHEDDGRETLTLLVINLGDDAIEKPLRLEGKSLAGPADVYLMDAERMEAGSVATPVASISPADGETIVLPGRSATLFVAPLDK
jgi:alpha-L-arabinofuranosidase